MLKRAVPGVLALTGVGGGGLGKELTFSLGLRDGVELWVHSWVHSGAPRLCSWDP